MTAAGARTLPVTEFLAAQQLHADADSIALLSLCDAATADHTAIRSVPFGVAGTADS